MAFTKRVLNRGLLAAGSVLLAITSLSLISESLWLLARYHEGVAAVSLATVIIALAAAVSFRTCDSYEPIADYP